MHFMNKPLLSPQEFHIVEKLIVKEVASNTAMYMEYKECEYE